MCFPTHATNSIYHINYVLSFFFPPFLWEVKIKRKIFKMWTYGGVSNVSGKCIKMDLSIHTADKIFSLEGQVTGSELGTERRVRSSCCRFSPRNPTFLTTGTVHFAGIFWTGAVWRLDWTGQQMTLGRTLKTTYDIEKLFSPSGFSNSVLCFMR